MADKIMMAAHGAAAWWDIDYGHSISRDVITDAVDAAEPYIQIAELQRLLERHRNNPEMPVAILVAERIDELSGRKL